MFTLFRGQGKPIVFFRDLTNCPHQKYTQIEIRRLTLREIWRTTDCYN